MNDGCEVERCAREVLAVGQPDHLVEHCGRPARDGLAGDQQARLAGRSGAGGSRRRVAAVVLVRRSQRRTMFSFYAVAFLPFLVMAITMCLGFILGPKTVSARRRTIGATAVGGFLLLATLAAIAMAPLWIADVLPYDDWLDRLFGIKSWV